MPYPGLAVVVMVGIGLGALLYYVFSEPGQPGQGYENTNGYAPPRNNQNTTWTSSSSGTRRQSSRRSSVRDESIFNDITCAICFYDIEGANRMRIRPCGHYFHRDCITSWRIQGPNVTRDSCPLCRNVIRTAMT